MKTQTKLHDANFSKFLFNQVSIPLSLDRIAKPNERIWIDWRRKLIEERKCFNLNQWFCIKITFMNSINVHFMLVVIDSLWQVLGYFIHGFKKGRENHVSTWISQWRRRCLEGVQCLNIFQKSLIFSFSASSLNVCDFIWQTNNVSNAD